MHDHDILLRLVATLLAALLGGWLLDIVRQPPIMGYILAGAVLGNIFAHSLPHREFFELGGELGLVLMLFFIGLEVDLSRLAQDWKIPFLGTLFLTLTSTVLGLLSGWFLDWSLGTALFFGFMISLSSTAVVLRILQEFGGTDSYIGRKILGILLVQDLLVIPMLITMGAVAGESVETSLLWRQILGGAGISALAVLLATRKTLRLPTWLKLERNREFRIFAGLVFCLGSATISGMLGLSPALGAFLSGLILGRLEDQLQLHNSLEPFKILFMAIFFMTIGLLVRLDFLWTHGIRILFLVILVLIVNTIITAAVLRLLGLSLTESLAAACLLAQIGEFAFLLAASAQGLKLISAETYQIAVAVIALSLLFTPLWFGLARKLMRASLGHSATIAFQITPKDGLKFISQSRGN